MSESADEAQARVIAPVLAKIVPETLYTADELRPGDRVKVCGEWYGFMRHGGTGDLVLRADVGGLFRYGPTRGEQFIVLRDAA